MKPGDKLCFLHYAQRKFGTIARVSDCGTIVHLTDGRWLHAESVMLID